MTRRRYTEAEKVYDNGEVRVYWEPELCIHTGNCVRAQPAVFRPAERPWVRLDEADAGAVVEAVLRCPTGALHVEREGLPVDAEDSPPVLDVVPNGPLYVRGPVEVAVAGAPVRTDSRVALCRCGATSRPPFCDGSHRRHPAFDHFRPGEGTGPVTADV